MDRRHIDSLIEMISEGHTEEEIVHWIRLIKDELEELVDEQWTKTVRKGD